jgi:glycosyltransferase involved in cell wall biosynthesis
MKNLKWVADFRDPWTNIDFYKDLNLTGWADAVHHRMEREVIQGADAVLVVSNGMAEEFMQMRPKSLKVITNGYDESDVEQVEVKFDEKFTISHIGTLNAARNPRTVWKALSQLCADNKAFEADLQIQLVGKVDFSVIEEIQSLGLEANLTKIDYLPHADAIARQQSSQLLLLLINNTANAKGILTGKFFEYLASGRPILGVGPVDGDAATVLKQTSAGVMVDFDDVEAAKLAIWKYYEQYRAGTLQVDTSSVEQFSRRNLTKELAGLLDGLKRVNK